MYNMPNVWVEFVCFYYLAVFLAMHLLFSFTVSTSFIIASVAAHARPNRHTYIYAKEGKSFSQHICPNCAGFS